MDTEVETYLSLKDGLKESKSVLPGRASAGECGKDGPTQPFLYPFDLIM